MRYYVAGGFDRWRQIRLLIEVIEKNGDTVTHDWTADGEAVELGTLEESEDTLREAGLGDLRGVDDAECLIAWLPGGAGTHVEIGFALGRGIPIVIHCSDRDWAKIPFYRHPLVTRVHIGFCLNDVLAEAEAWARSWEK